MVENPCAYFLLENVKMKKQSKIDLDNYLGVTGVEINSNLMSYQNRKRVYWTNINFNELKDKQISFQDFKQSSDLSDYKLNRTSCTERMWNGGMGRKSMKIICCENVTHSKKVQCLTTRQYRAPNAGLVEYEDFCRLLTREELEQAQTVPKGYTNCLSYNQMQSVLGNGWTVDVIAHIFSGLKQ